MLPFIARASFIGCCYEELNGLKISRWKERTRATAVKLRKQEQVLVR